MEILFNNVTMNEIRMDLDHNYGKQSQSASHKSKSGKNPRHSRLQDQQQLLNGNCNHSTKTFSLYIDNKLQSNSQGKSNCTSTKLNSSNFMNNSNLENKINLIEKNSRSQSNPAGHQTVNSSSVRNRPFQVVTQCRWLVTMVVVLWCVVTLHARTTTTRENHTTTTLTSINSQHHSDYLPELRPRVPLEPLHQYRIFFQTGNSEEELPVCSSHSVCNKISTYGKPYAERMCRCPQEQECSTSLDISDGYTFIDKDSQFKLCEPVKKLPQCKFFSEVSYTMIFYPDNITQLVVHCTCPKNAVTYVIHKDPYRTSKGFGYFYSFACSPLELSCKRKEPCRLFSARKRAEFEEVTTTILCRCPSNRSCPSHHTDHGVVPGKTYSEDPVRTYSGYCV